MGMLSLTSLLARERATRKEIKGIMIVMKETHDLLVIGLST